MAHTRREIIVNQNSFHKEITAYLKKDIKITTKDLSKIETPDKKITEEKDKLIKKLKKIPALKQIESLIISERNIYPKHYAWWNDEIQEVEINKYID